MYGCGADTVWAGGVDCGGGGSGGGEVRVVGAELIGEGGRWTGELR